MHKLHTKKKTQNVYLIYALNVVKNSKKIQYEI